MAGGGRGGRRNFGGRDGKLSGTPSSHSSI